DECLRSLNSLQEELNGQKRRIEGLEASISGREPQLARLEADFNQHLSAAGFANEDALLQASLSRERFTELTRWAEDLRREETEIRTRQEDRATALQTELEKNLTAGTLEQMQQEDAALTLQLSELQRELGAMSQKLND